jgi:hypothetical protein
VELKIPFPTDNHDIEHLEAALLREVRLNRTLRTLLEPNANKPNAAAIHSARLNEYQDGKPPCTKKTNHCASLASDDICDTASDFRRYCHLPSMEPPQLNVETYSYDRNAVNSSVFDDVRAVDWGNPVAVLEAWAGWTDATLHRLKTGLNDLNTLQSLRERNSTAMGNGHTSKDMKSLVAGSDLAETSEVSGSDLEINCDDGNDAHEASAALLQLRRSASPQRDSYYQTINQECDSDDHAMSGTAAGTIVDKTYPDGHVMQGKHGGESINRVDNLERELSELFPDRVLRLSRKEFAKWKAHSNVRSLSTQESKALAKLRRKVLSRVYANRARNRRSVERKLLRLENAALRNHVLRSQ